MAYRYHRSYRDNDSKNAQGMVLFGLSLAFLTFLVVSMAMFAVHVKKELDAAAQEQDALDEAARANRTRNDSYADANRGAGNTRNGTVTKVVRETTPMGAKRRHLRRRVHDFTVAPAHRRKPRAHAEKKTVDGVDERTQKASKTNVPQVHDPEARPTKNSLSSTHHQEIAPPTTATLTTTAATTPTVRMTTSATTTAVTTTAVTTTAVTTTSTRTETPTVAPRTASQDASSTIWTRAIAKALTTKRHPSPTELTTPRATRKIIAAKEVVPGREKASSHSAPRSTRKVIAAKGVIPGREAKKTPADGAAVAPLVMVAPMAGPGLERARHPATHSPSFIRPETRSIVSAKAGGPEASKATLSPRYPTGIEAPSNESAPLPKRDDSEALTSARELEASSAAASSNEAPQTDSHSIVPEADKESLATDTAERR